MIALKASATICLMFVCLVYHHTMFELPVGDKSLGREILVAIAIFLIILIAIWV